MAVKGGKKVTKKVTKKVVKAKATAVKRPSAKVAKKVVKKAAPKKTAATKAKSNAKTGKVKSVKVAAKKTAAKKTTAKKPVAKKAAAKKVVAKKVAVKKPVAKKAAVKKVVAKKPVAKKAVAKKPAVKKTVVKKPAVKKAAPEKKIVKKAAVKRAVKKSEKPLISKTIPKKKSMTATTYDVIEENVTTKTAPSKRAATLLGALEFTPYHSGGTEGYMNEEQREHFRNILGAWKQQLMQDVDTTVGHLKEEAVFYADPVDRASQEEGFNLELRTRDRERRLIKKIEQSLDLLSSGDYGYCEDCGSEIGIRRLEARPTAVKCIDCKTFQEIREKQLGG